MAKPPKKPKPELPEQELSDDEVERRRDAALKRMLSMPPRQHKEDVGKKRSSQTGAPVKGKRSKSKQGKPR